MLLKVKIQVQKKDSEELKIQFFAILQKLLVKNVDMLLGKNYHEAVCVPN